MALTHYTPWSLLNDFQREMNDFFSHRGLLGQGTDVTTTATSQWMPAVDIQEEANCYVILADIPGVDPENIEINMENGILSIKGERESKKEEKGDNYRRAERQWGSFERRLTLPEFVQEDKIEASSKDGVLKLVLPKIKGTSGKHKILVKH